MMGNGNGLKFATKKSETKPFENLSFSDYESFKLQIKDIFGQNNGFCVVYLDYKVLIGKYSEGKFKFYNDDIFKPKYIQKMRIFNINQELYLWRKNGEEFRCRLRIDGSGIETDVIDACQILWGTKAESLGEFSKIFEEDRGTELILPLKDISVDNGQNRVHIRTRNYISYGDNDQAGYEDCRFVGFKYIKNNIRG